MPLNVPPRHIGAATKSHNSRCGDAKFVANCRTGGMQMKITDYVGEMIVIAILGLLATAATYAIFMV